MKETMWLSKEEQPVWVFFYDILSDEIDEYGFNSEEEAWEYIATLGDMSFDSEIGILTLGIL